MAGTGGAGSLSWSERRQASTRQGGNHCCWPLLSCDPNRKQLRGPLGRLDPEGRECRTRDGDWTFQTLPPTPTLLALCPRWSLAEAGHTHHRHLHIWDTGSCGHCPCPESLHSFLRLLGSSGKVKLRLRRLRQQRNCCFLSGKCLALFQRVEARGGRFRLVLFKSSPNGAGRRQEERQCHSG